MKSRHIDPESIRIHSGPAAKRIDERNRRHFDPGWLEVQSRWISGERQAFYASAFAVAIGGMVLCALGAVLMRGCAL